MVCVAGNITGATRFSGSKTAHIVDKTPLIVLLLPVSATLKPNMSDSICHRTPRTHSKGNSSRLTSRDGLVLFARSIAEQTLQLLLTNFVRFNPLLTQTSINYCISLIASSGVGTDFKR